MVFQKIEELCLLYFRKNDQKFSYCFTAKSDTYVRRAVNLSFHYLSISLCSPKSLNSQFFIKKGSPFDGNQFPYCVTCGYMNVFFLDVHFWFMVNDAFPFVLLSKH